MTPPDPDGAAAPRTVACQLDRNAEAGNCSDDRYAGRSAPTRTDPRNRCLPSAELNVRIRSPPAASQSELCIGRQRAEPPLTLPVLPVSVSLRQNNRAENSDLPVRRRERKMQGRGAQDRQARSCRETCPETLCRPFRAGAWHASRPRADSRPARRGQLHAGRRKRRDRARFACRVFCREPGVAHAWLLGESKQNPTRFHRNPGGQLKRLYLGASWVLFAWWSACWLRRSTESRGSYE